MPKHVDPPRFIHLPQVLEMTGLSTSTIYRWITDGTFPKQIHLGSRSVVWNEREVIDWMNQQMSKTSIYLQERYQLMNKKITEVQCENILESVNSLREWHGTNESPEDDQFEYT